VETGNSRPVSACLHVDCTVLRPVCNVVWTFASLGQYVYVVSQDTVYFNLYTLNQTKFKLPMVNLRKGNSQNILLTMKSNIRRRRKA
jgi:DUF1680 family protein